MRPTGAAEPAVQLAGATEPAVRLAGVSKSFGAVRAVAGINVTIGRGETVALLGPTERSPPT